MFVENNDALRDNILERAALLYSIEAFHLAIVTFYYFGNIWYSNRSGRKKYDGQSCVTILSTTIGTRFKWPGMTKYEVSNTTIY